MTAFQIKPFGELTTAQLHRITRAREAVFYLEQHVTCPDADEVDPCSVFLWAEQDMQVIAFARLIPPGVVYEEASIGRVLVRASHRRRGICRAMMQSALEHIAATWGGPVRISAQEYLCPFYASLGFEPVSELYDEAGIPHIKMLRQ